MYYSGKRISGVSLTFTDGVVIQSSATENEDAEIDILVAVDEIHLNDGLLSTSVSELLAQVHPGDVKAVNFIMDILQHRLRQTDLSVRNILDDPLDLRALRRSSRIAILGIISQYLQHTDSLRRTELGVLGLLSLIVSLSIHDEVFVQADELAIQCCASLFTYASDGEFETSALDVNRVFRGFLTKGIVNDEFVEHSLPKIVRQLHFTFAATVALAIRLVI